MVPIKRSRPPPAVRSLVTSTIGTISQDSWKVLEKDAAKPHPGDYSYPRQRGNEDVFITVIELVLTRGYPDRCLRIGIIEDHLEQ